MTLGPTMTMLRLQDRVPPSLSEGGMGWLARYRRFAAMYRFTCSSSTASGSAPWLSTAS